jgi:hypothetical protein
MRVHPIPALLVLGVALALAGAAPRAEAAAAFNAEWTAASGAPPDSACPKWRWAANVGRPVLAGGVLRLETGACGSNSSFWHSDTSFALPDTFVVEARLRVQSYSECVGPCGSYRTGANLSVTTAPSVGVLFHIGAGQVFVTTAECGGKLAAAVPTTDAMHTYRLEVHGAQVRVFRDGALLLTSSTYASAADHGPAPRVGWGEASSLAFGISDWEFVRHNGHATGCATLGAPPAGGAAALALHAWPNPADGVSHVAWTQARAARVRVDVFDASGRRVRRLADAEMGAGPHELAWDGRDAGGRRVAPGAYLCRVDAGATVATRRVVRAR